MNGILGLGKYLIALPIAIFGIFHFMKAENMKGMAFGSEVLVYLTGLALIAAAVSILIGKLDKLAATLLGIMLLLFIIPHAQMLSADETQMMAILKNMIMAGGAFLYARYAAHDRSVIG